ncbi:hypothetical protein PTKIN_Ptkin17bG0060900 [Pterospermum kingtungense]
MVVEYAIEEGSDKFVDRQSDDNDEEDEGDNDDIEDDLDDKRDNDKAEDKNYDDSEKYDDKGQLMQKLSLNDDGVGLYWQKLSSSSSSMDRLCTFILLRF